MIPTAGSPQSNPVPESAQAAIRRHVEALSKARLAVEADSPKDYSLAAFSSQYKDPLITLSPDRLTAYGTKGWASVLASNGGLSGNWWYELKILRTENEDAAVRPGWSLRYTRFDAPIGMDMFSVAVRDRDGCLVYGGARYGYFLSPFQAGDVIGCGITLGTNQPEPLQDPRLRPELHQYVQAGLLCNPNRPPAIRKNPASGICYMINGQLYPERLLGKLPSGRWHPGVALFNGAAVRLNLGPDFKYPIPPDYRPCSEMTPPPF